MNDDGTMMRPLECRAFADAHGLVMVSIADLIPYRRPTERLVERVAETRLPTEFGEFPAFGYSSDTDDRSTSRSSPATSATASTCWCACTRSA